MTEIYYCRNEDDMKRVAIHIFTHKFNNAGAEDALADSGICVCDYINKKISDDEEEIYDCYECADREDECVLCDHLKDKDVFKHIEIYNTEVEYPCVVCIADTYYPDEKFTICSVTKAKENTKYGVSR